MDVATWNVLHDGRVISIEGKVPGDLRLSIEIEYLCGSLATRSGHMVVKLVGCERFEYLPYQEPPVTVLSEIVSLTLGLLTAKLVAGCLSIQCSGRGYGGQLLLRYDVAHTATAEGVALTQAELESAADRYWSDWQQRHK